MNDRSLDILQLSMYDIGGGADRIAWNLHQQLNQRGHRAKMAVGEKRTINDNVLHIDHNAAKSRLTRMLLRSSRRLCDPLHGLKFKGAWRLGQLLANVAEPDRQRDIREGYEDFHFPATQDVVEHAAGDVDILHLHNLHGGYFDLRALPELCNKVATVLTLHDAWMLGGHCAHSLDCDKWRTGCVGCAQLDLPPAIEKDNAAANWQIKKRLYEQCELNVITPCRWLMDKVEDSMLWPAVKHAAVIPNGVDLQVYKQANQKVVRNQLNLPLEAKILLFSASGIRKAVWKDYHTMRQAVGAVAEKLGGERIIFLALGDDCPNERIGGAEIRFVQFRAEPAEVAKYYQAADIYLHAAKVDTFPNVILEAMACGCPVVATDVGGIGEQVVEGRNGFLTPASDAQSMAARVVQLLNNPIMRRTFTRHAANHAVKYFDLQDQVARYLDFYDTVLGRASLRKAA